MKHSLLTLVPIVCCVLAGFCPATRGDDCRCAPSFQDDILQDKKPEPPREQQAAPQEAAMHWRLPPVPRRWVVRSPKLDQDKVVRALPDSVEDIVAAGGGRFLMLSLPRIGQVAIFDVNESRVVKYLGVGSKNFGIAAGMTRLVVALPDTKVLQRWDLRTLTCDRTVPMPDGRFSALAMGHASEGPLLVQTGGNLVFLDLDTMKQMVPGNASQKFPTLGHLRVSGDGRLFTRVGRILQLNATGYSVEAPAEFATARPDRVAIPGPDGQHIFSSGAIFDSEGKKGTLPAGAHAAEKDGGPGSLILPDDFVPAYHTPFFLRVPTGLFSPTVAGARGFEAVSVHISGNDRPVVTLKGINGIFRDFDDQKRAKVVVDQHYHLLPDADLLVTIPVPVRDRLELHRLHLAEALAQADAYLFVRSAPRVYAVHGKEYRYALEVKTKQGVAQINVEAGPPGMKTAGTTLTWAVPADFAGKETDVTLKVKDKAGQEILHSFTVHVVKELPADAEAPAAFVVAKKAPEPDFKIEPAPGNSKLDIKAPALDKETVTLALPGAVTDMVVGGGGRFLLIAIPKAQKVALFDVNEVKIVHHFPLSSDKVLVAAGMDKLLLVDPVSKSVERWSLLTRERELTVKVKELKISHALLGSASQGPVGFGNGSLYDLQTLKPLPWQRVWPRVIIGAVKESARVSADGTVFSVWDNGSPMMLQALVRIGEQMRGYTQRMSVGHIVPGPDGKVLYTGGGGLFTNETRPLGNKQDSTFALPAAHGNFYLTCRFPEDRRSFTKSDPAVGITVHLTGEKRPIATLPFDLTKPPGYDHTEGFERFREDGVPFDKRIHFIPAARMIVTLDSTNDRLVVRRFDVEEALLKAGIDYLFVALHSSQQVLRGRELIYALPVRSKHGGVRVTVESGPAGLKVSKAGVVYWKVPADAPAGEQNVLLTIRDQAGQEIYHTFTVRVLAADSQREKADPSAKK